MKSNIKKHKNCKKVVEVKLSPERVKEAFEKVYRDIQKVANVPGYRVGKAPRDLLELHYGKTAKEEVIKSLIPETYGKILEQHKLDPIGYPDISDVKLDLKDGFYYKASIETRPEFSLKSYKGLKLKRKSIEVKEEDVQKNLESLREMHAQKVPKKEGSEGEEKEKVLPKLDDEFAKDLGLENLAKLKEAVKDGLRKRLEQDSKADLEMQLINQLVDGVNFEVPESLVNSEKERLVKDANNRLAYMQAIQKQQDPKKEFALDDKDKKELEANAEKQALRQVKAFFILDRIGQAEKIYLKQEDLDQQIGQIAKQHKKTKEEVRSQLEKNRMLDEMAVNIRNAKVIEFLLKEAKVS